MEKPMTNIMVDYLIELVKVDFQERNKCFKKDVIKRLKRLRN